MAIALAVSGCKGFVDEHRAERHQELAEVESWFYYLGFNPEDGLNDQIVDSPYDLVVMEPIFTEADNTRFPAQRVVRQLHGGRDGRLVLAYVDIGQAERWRTYWEDGWGVGDPEWIVGKDPDGWTGNFPVAYWYRDWQKLWVKRGGIVDELVDAGFDGIYLDWVEAYSDPAVRKAARRDGVDAEEEMVWWVEELAVRGRKQNPMFMVIGQNAAELAWNEDYTEVVDGIAQEQTWFDGGADNDPPGDCPLPSTDADVDTRAYEDSLNAACLELYIEYPDSTLHVSSASYLEDLDQALARNRVVFTVDYAIEPDNVRFVHETARERGYVPFAGERALDTFIEPWP